MSDLPKGSIGKCPPPTPEQARAKPPTTPPPNNTNPAPEATEAMIEPLTDEEIEAAFTALTQLLDPTGCPVAVMTSVDSAGFTVSLHFSASRARRLAMQSASTEDIRPAASDDVMQASSGCVFFDLNIKCAAVDCPICARAAIAALSPSRDALVEALEAIIDRAPERDIKWAGMTARDIAIAALAQQQGNEPK